PTIGSMYRSSSQSANRTANAMSEGSGSSGRARGISGPSHEDDRLFPDQKDETALFARYLVHRSAFIDDERTGGVATSSAFLRAAKNVDVLEALMAMPRSRRPRRIAQERDGGTSFVCVENASSDARPRRLPLRGRPIDRLFEIENEMR